MTARWIVAKYISDLRRREPINIGVVLYVDSTVLMRFLGENDRGVINGRRLRGKVEALANYKAWIAHWRKAAHSVSPADLIGLPVRDSNYFLEDGGEAIRTDRSPHELLRYLFEELVATPSQDQTSKAEVLFERLHVDVEEDVFVSVPAIPTTGAFTIGPNEKPLVDELYFEYRYKNGQTNLMRSVRLAPGKAWDRLGAVRYSFEKARLANAGNLIALVQRAQGVGADEAARQLRLIGQDAEIVELDNEDAAAQRLADLLHVG